MNSLSSDKSLSMRAISESIGSLTTDPLNHSLNRLSTVFESLTLTTPSPPSPPRNVHLVHADTLGETYALRKYATDVVAYELKNATDAFHNEMQELRADQAISTDIVINRILSQEYVVGRVDRNINNMIKQCHESDRCLIQLMDRLKQFDLAVHHNECLLNASLSEQR